MDRSKIKTIDIFSWAGCMFNKKPLKMVGFEFIKKNVEDGNNITIRSWASIAEVQSVIQKYMTGKNWKKKFRKQASSVK